MQKLIKIAIQIKGVHPVYLDDFIFKTQNKLKKIGLNYTHLIFLPKKTERFTVLRSPHVDKKSREQFEKVTHKRVLYLYLNNPIMLYKVITLLTGNSSGIELRISYYNSTNIINWL